MIIRTARILILAGALALTVTGAAPASAAVIRSGSCSANSGWTLKLSHENGRIEVEFEVDSHVNGKTWHVQIRENDSLIFSGDRVTQAPDGSFEVRKLAPETSGTDSFRARAVNAATGETCLGKASI